MPRTQRCDNKLYAIAALRRVGGHWEDDCQTLHEFRDSNLSAPPVVHRRVLPFQSYALAKGFDNCLYSVTKAPTDPPEYVYRYDPATQTLNSTFFYDIHRTGGGSERLVRDLAWHMYFPAELDGLLEVAGLQPLERRGGWNGEPLDAGARRYVFVCGPL